MPFAAEGATARAPVRAIAHAAGLGRAPATLSERLAENRQAVGAGGKAPMVTARAPGQGQGGPCHPGDAQGRAAPHRRRPGLRRGRDGR
jgi:hypothetical protein